MGLERHPFGQNRAPTAKQMCGVTKHCSLEALQAADVDRRLGVPASDRESSFVARDASGLAIIASVKIGTPIHGNTSSNSAYSALLPLVLSVHLWDVAIPTRSRNSDMKRTLPFCLIVLLPVSSAAQTASGYYTVPSTTTLKELTTRPAVVGVVEGNPGIFNWSTTPCGAADDIFQVAPTSGPSGCYIRMGTPYALGKSTITNGVLVTDGSGDPSISVTLPPVNGSSISITAAGSTTARSLRTRTAEVVNPRDFGAVGNGSTDDTAAFQAAINSVGTGHPVQLYVSPGTYVLGSNVVANGRFPSWSIQAGTTFSGTGTLAFPNTDNYGDRGIKNAFLAGQRGNAAEPVSDLSALIFLKKVTNGAATSSTNPTAVFAAERRGVTLPDARAQALFTEVLDFAGGSGTFSEGARAHCILKAGAANGACYGAVTVGGAEDSVPWKYLIGHESEIINKTSAAPPPYSFNKNHYAASYVATVGLAGTASADAGFVTNPFTSGPKFRTGMLIAEDSVDFAGVANRAQLDTLIGNYGNVATAFYGGNVSYAALLLQNGTSSTIRARNGTNTTDHNILTYSSTDHLILGQQAAAISLPNPLIYGGVQLNNAVTGTGSMVLSVSPTLAGTLTGGNANFSGPVKPGGYTVKTLPVAPGTGARAYVTDAVTCTFGGELKGGGSAYCPVTFNGMAWQGG